LFFASVDRQRYALLGTPLDAYGASGPATRHSLVAFATRRAVLGARASRSPSLTQLSYGRVKPSSLLCFLRVSTGSATDAK